MRQRYILEEYQRVSGRNPFQDWLHKLDKYTWAKIQMRLRRMESGLLGDCKSLGEGLWEARLHFGAGFRVYYFIEGLSLIMLLMGGSKRHQGRNIEKAREYLKDYLGRKHGKAKR